MNRLETAIERVILYSRYVLVVFYIGLGVALAVYAAKFAVKLSDMVLRFAELSDTDMLLKVLGLIDASLVAGLIVMVMLSSYENFVSRFDDTGEREVISWLGHLDPGSLKIKVAMAIVAISSIHLLQVFMTPSRFSESDITWMVIIHALFVVSALFLAVIDRIAVIFRGKDGGH